MPIPYVLAYAALIKGLFYGKSSLETLVRSCAGISESDVAKAKDALMESATTPRCISARRLRFAMSLSHSHAAGLPAAEWCFLDPLAELVARRVTLADLDISTQ